MKEDTERRLFGRRHTGAEWLILYGALGILAFTAGFVLFFGMMRRGISLNALKYPFDA